MNLVWARRETTAVAAGFRYLLVHVVGGLILLAGIVLQVYQSPDGSLDFTAMDPFADSAGWGPALILVGGFGFLATVRIFVNDGNSTSARYLMSLASMGILAFIYIAIGLVVVLLNT